MSYFFYINQEEKDSRLEISQLAIKKELQQLLFNKIVNGTLQTPYAWKTELSTFGRLNMDSDEANTIAFCAK